MVELRAFTMETTRLIKFRLRMLFILQALGQIAAAQNNYWFTGFNNPASNNNAVNTNNANSNNNANSYSNGNNFANYGSSSGINRVNGQTVQSSSNSAPYNSKSGGFSTSTGRDNGFTASSSNTNNGFDRSSARSYSGNVGDVKQAFGSNAGQLLRGGEEGVQAAVNTFGSGSLNGVIGPKAFDYSRPSQPSIDNTPPNVKQTATQGSNLGYVNSYLDPLGSSAESDRIAAIRQSYSNPRFGGFQSPSTNTQNDGGTVFRPVQNGQPDNRSPPAAPIITNPYSPPTTFNGNGGGGGQDSFFEVGNPLSNKQAVISGYRPSNNFVDPSHFIIPKEDKFAMVNQLFSGDRGLRSFENQQQPAQTSQPVPSSSKIDDGLNKLGEDFYPTGNQNSGQDFNLGFFKDDFGGFAPKKQFGDTSSKSNQPSSPTRSFSQTGVSNGFSNQGRSTFDNSFDTRNFAPKQTTNFAPKQTTNFAPKQTAGLAPTQNSGFAPKQGFPTQQTNGFAPKQGFPTQQTNGFAPKQGFPTQQTNGFAPKQSAGFSSTQGSNFAPKQTTGFAPQQNTGFAPQQNADFAPKQGFPTKQTIGFAPTQGFPPKQTVGFAPKQGFPPKQTVDFAPKQRFPPKQTIGFAPEQGFPPKQTIGFAPKQGFPPKQTVDFAPKQGFPPKQTVDFAPKQGFPPKQTIGFAPKQEFPQKQTFGFAPKETTNFAPNQPTGFGTTQVSGFAPKQEFPPKQTIGISPQQTQGFGSTQPSGFAPKQTYGFAPKQTVSFAPQQQNSGLSGKSNGQGNGFSYNSQQENSIAPDPLSFKQPPQKSSFPSAPQTSGFGTTQNGGSTGNLTPLFSGFSPNKRLTVDEFQNKNLLGDQGFGQTEYDRNRPTSTSILGSDSYRQANFGGQNNFLNSRPQQEQQQVQDFRQAPDATKAFRSRRLPPVTPPNYIDRANTFTIQGAPNQLVNGASGGNGYNTVSGGTQSTGNSYDQGQSSSQGYDRTFDNNLLRSSGGQDSGSFDTYGQGGTVSNGGNQGNSNSFSYGSASPNNGGLYSYPNIGFSRASSAEAKTGASNSGPAKGGYSSSYQSTGSYKDGDAVSTGDAYSTSSGYKDGDSTGGQYSTHDQNQKDYQDGWEKDQSVSDKNSYSNVKGQHNNYSDGKKYDVSDGYTDNINYSKKNSDASQSEYNTADGYQDGVSNVQNAVSGRRVNPYSGLRDSSQAGLNDNAHYKPFNVNGPVEFF